MVLKILIILGILSVTCLARPEDSRAPKGACVDSRGAGRCAPLHLCKPDSSGNHLEIRHPITPPCQNYYDICCPTERVIEWMPPDIVP